MGYYTYIKNVIPNANSHFAILKQQPIIIIKNLLLQLFFDKTITFEK